MAMGEKKKKKIDVEMDDPPPEPPPPQKKKKSKVPKVNVDNPSLDDPASGNRGEERQDLPKIKRRKLGAEAIELTGLEVYWKLPSLDPAERQAAALALVRELQAAQQTFEAVDGRVENGAERILLGEEHSDGALKSCAPELQYALPRLVRGVGSSNQCARQGFATALSTAIHALPSITGDIVLKLIDKEIEVSSALKGQDIKDGLLGRLFAYASIVRADSLIQNGTTDEQQKLAKHVAEKLLTLGFKKAFLREPAASIFLDLSERLALSTLQKSVFTLPIFLEWLNASPEVGGADALLLTLRLWRKLPDSLSAKCRMLPMSGSLQQLVQASHLDVLIPYLKESSSSHPRLHMVWNALADIFLEQGLSRTRQKKSKQKNDFASKEHSLIIFWTRVVDESLLESSHERKFLAMRLVLLFLSKLPISCTPIILSAAYGRCLLDILSGQDNVLHSAAQQFVSDLCAWAGENQDRLVLTIGFLQQSSSGKFDHLTKSSTVKHLLGKVTSEESCLRAIQNLQRLFVSDAVNATEESDDAQRMDASKKIWMVELMTSFSKQAVSVSKSMSAAKEVARFLAAHIFLDSDAVNTDKVKALIKSASDVSKAEKDEYIGKLRSLLSEKSPRSKDDDIHEDLSYDIVEFFRSAWTKPEKGTVQRSLRDAIFQISSAIEKEENRSKKLEAMRSLLSQLFIQSHLEPGSMDDIVNELLICCNKAFGKVVDVSLEDTDDMEDEEEAPSMGDVLLDIILSVLSQSPAPIRAAAEQMFGLFCGEITTSGLSSLLKVISKQTGHTRQEPLFDIEDDDDEDVLSVEEVTTDNEASEVSDPEEDQGTGGKQQDDKQIQGAMDDAELSDMDDEAMFRMDAHLAQILKAKKRGEPDTQAQLVQFKFRVLGLLDTYLQKQSENVAVLTVLPTLFQSYLHASSDGHKQLSDRIGGVLNRLLKAKDYPKGSEVDKDLLEKLLILASRTTDQKLRGLSQGFVFWLLKVSQATCGEADEDVVQTLLSALDDVFQKKKNTLPLSFLRDGAVRYPWLRGVAIGKLLSKAKDGRTDYEKAEAMELSSSVLKHYTRPGSKPAGSSETSSDIEPLLPLLGELLILYFAKPLKKAKQASFFRFAVAWLEALPVLFPDRPLSKLVDTGALSSAVNDYVFSGNAKATKTKLESLLSQDRRK